MGEVRIGISGWRYAGWRGVFYPPGLAQRAELAYASRQFPTIEINGTFYSLQRPQFFASWYRETPADFVFAVKGGRFITHMKRLRDVETPLANFFASGLLVLEEKLGPILWQLPARFAFDEERLGPFFEMLPRDTRAAARLARRHDARVAGRAFVESGAARPIRHALEPRHPSFGEARCAALLRRHGIALVLADGPGLPAFDEITADFAYLRLHGAEVLYAGGYSDAALADWARRIRAWRRKSDVYVYFDNDAKVRAPVDAANLMRRLGRKK
jgi:uncharacterized protein YecE (DUF72 family)